MCGISGFNWSDKTLIKSMTDVMKCRGPDDEGHYVDKAVSLGHRRLSIIDLSSAGHQPMLDDEEKLVLVYNGEIYNYIEIKKELSDMGYSFKTKTDTETLLYAYKEWGPECVKKFNGMFAFAIYDKNKNIIFLARDHIGIKPLYYYIHNDKFIFSSTIEPILLHKIRTSPNKKVIRDFLLYKITDHTGETFFKNILKFPKGHYGIFHIEKNEFELHKWWELKFKNDYRKRYPEAVKELRKIMEESVDRQLISDVPVGTCLSGGIDSSTIACLIKKSKRAEIETFSAVFPGFEKNEEKYIDAISAHTDMKNHKTYPTYKDVKNEMLDFIRYMGEPVPTPSPYVQYKVFQLSKNHNITVLLDGQGADELFAGYHYFYGFYIKGLIRKGHIFKSLKEIRGLVKGKNYGIGLKSIGFLFMPWIVRRRFFIKNSNISKKLLESKTLETGFFKKYYSLNSLHEALEFHLNYKLEHLLKWEDRNSMAHSREARVPFLDMKVLEFVLSLPEEYIISGGKTKAILRDAMKGIVPEKILDRRDKVGYATPESSWLCEEDMKNLLEEWFIKNEPLCKKYVDLSKTRKMICDHTKRKKDHGRALWRTLFLEAWLRVYFSNGGHI